MVMQAAIDPKPRIAGIAGVLAGVGLLIEGVLWSGSGWTPDTFASPSAALNFLNDSGGNVRAAVFAGMINLVFATIFVVGLASVVRNAAPTLASAVLYLGLVGVAAHGLVPAGLWLGVPSFTDLAASNHSAALGAWGGFAAFIAGAGGLGGLFLGLSVLAAGLAIARTKVLPVGLGWVGAIAGAASVISVLAAETSLASLAEAAYFPSLVLIIAFRLWGGLALWRDERRAVAPLQPSPTST
jgi:Domain of unknown function (DUF4386)